MNSQILKNLCAAKNLGRADLARMAGVSRAAVTRWFRQAGKDGWINVETDTLRELAKNLNLSPAKFFATPPSLIEWQTHFLWDSAYPDMELFLKALSEFQPQAVARLLQVLGFRETRAILGPKTVSQFQKYKHFIKPARRRELETIWELYR